MVDSNILGAVAVIGPFPYIILNAVLGAFTLLMTIVDRTILTVCMVVLYVLSVFRTNKNTLHRVCIFTKGDASRPLFYYRYKQIKYDRYDEHYF